MLFCKNNNMTYEELLINIDLNGYENVLPSVGKTFLDDSHWFVVCDDGDCHLFDKNGKEDDISKIKEINEDMIPKDIKKIVIPNSTMSIGYCAFYGCSILISVKIPNSITSIWEWAFYNCSGLVSITIPNNVMSIGYSAFYNCSKLMSVTIGNGVTSIGKTAFYGCSELTNITINKPIEHVKSMENYPWGIEDESIIKCN